MVSIKPIELILVAEELREKLSSTGMIPDEFNASVLLTIDIFFDPFKF
jgi:hypothetical protein